MRKRCSRRRSQNWNNSFHDACYANSSSRAFASFRSRVSKPSVNRLTIRQRMRWRIERGEEIRLITAAQDGAAFIVSAAKSYANSSSSAFASFRSRVSNPSVNHP